MAYDIKQMMPPIRWESATEADKAKWISDLQNKLADIQTFAVTLTPAQVAADTFSAQSFTVTGIQTNDKIISISAASSISSTEGQVTIASYRVSAANTILIVFENEHTAAVTPTSQVYTFIVLRTK
jgi:hypothetical protein